MYKILLPTDGSDHSQQAVKQGLAFAKALGAQVISVHVVPHFHMHPDEGDVWPTSKTVEKRVDEQHTARAREILASVEQEAKGAGIECQSVVAINDTIYEEIIGTAEENNCNLIVMASHGHAGVTALLLGSVTAKVLTHTKLPVLVLR